MGNVPLSSPLWADLLRNLGLVVALVGVWSYFSDRLREIGPGWRAMIMGLALGGGSIVAMAMPITVAPGLIVDLRAAIVSTAAFFGGPVTALIAFLMAGLYRFYLGGIGAWPGVAAIAVAAAVGVAGHALRRRSPVTAMQLLPLAAATTLGVFLTLFLLPYPVWSTLLPQLGLVTYAIIFASVLVLGLALLEGERHSGFRARAIAAETKMRLVATNLPGFLFVRKTDAEGRMWHSYVSSSISRILGTTANEVAGRPGLLRELVHPDDIAAFDATHKDAAERGVTANMSYRSRHRDGSWRWLHSHSTPRPWDKGVVAWDGIALDVTDRVEAELKLARSEQRFRAIFDSSFELMSLLDPAGTVIEVNRAALDHGGVELEEVVGRPIWETAWWQLDATSPAELQRAIGRAAAGETVRYDATIRGAAGQRITLDFSLKPIRDAGGAVAFLVAEGWDITERRLLEARIAHLAAHDPLTGLPNRRVFEAEFEQAHARAGSGRTELALLLIDLDRFKAVNDQLGHQGGDQLLIEVGRRLRACVRSGDLVARLGGDEFAVVAEAPPGSAELTSLAERIIAALSAPLALEGSLLVPSASLGMVRFPEHGTTPDELFSKADMALYAAKAVGTGRWQPYTEAMRLVTRPSLRPTPPPIASLFTSARAAK